MGVNDSRERLLDNVNEKKIGKKRDLPWSGEPDGLLERPGTGLQRPPCLVVSSCSISSNPALFWNRLMRFTTRGDMCVRTQGWPP